MPKLVFKTLCLVFKVNYERRYLISETLKDWRLGDDITSEGTEFQSLIHLWKNEYLKQFARATLGLILYSCLLLGQVNPIISK